jgi:tRNA (guanine37-N1)-methyltransferase
MKLSVLTLFPEVIEAAISSSITGRAREKGLYQLETIQIRQFAVNRYGKVDDACFGGGTGMLMLAEPVYQAWLAAGGSKQPVGDTEPSTRQHTIYLSPRGAVFKQETARRLASYEHLILICGHYEGIDQRLIDQVVDEEVSIGDFVLTGGELAACVVIDALLRLVPGVLPEEATLRESHMDGLLEYPQYTRPSIWHDHKVPDVLLSGHQAKIDAWQRSLSILETLRRRPDLIQGKRLDEETWQRLIENWCEFFLH